MLAYVEAPAGECPIVLEELQVDVVISGIYAETVQTLVFANPNSRPLEGSLVFPLPGGAVVTGYALDVDGELVEGVLVPKQEARRILEAEIRKGVDPGTIEQVAGNLYRVRVYPLPAGGRRTVRVTYVNELTIDGSAAAYHLHRPHELTLRVEIASPVPPVCAGLPLTEVEGGRWEARAKLAAGPSLLIRLDDLPEAFSLVQTSPQGETFYCVSVREAPLPEWRPGVLQVIWDASGSRQGTDRELEFLRELGRLWPGTQADLRVLRQELEGPRRFADLVSLSEYLREVPADGATDLGLLDLSEPAEGWLIFTDGLDTVHTGVPRAGLAPVFFISSQEVSNQPWMEALGTAINLRQSSIPRALERLRPAPSLPGHVVRSPGRLHVLGRLDGPVTVQGIHLDPARATPGRLLAWAWAARESRLLPAHRQLEWGRRYGLVTPGTALLVLETLEQYLEYGLTPSVRFQEAYQQHKNRRTQERRAHLDRVAKLWAERVEWWEQDFRPRWKPPEPAPAPAPADMMLRCALGSAGAPPPAPMACMSAPMARGPAREEAPPQPSGASIAIQAWDPQTPYLTSMRHHSHPYAAYLEQRAAYAVSPAFYLDCADYLLKAGYRTEGLRVLSNLSELALEDPALMRIQAYRLVQAGELDAAVQVLRNVLRLRPDEPQSHRDLALALIDRGRDEDLKQARALLYEVVTRSWERFPEIELIALMELNRLLVRGSHLNLANGIDPRLVRALELDLRISLAWDADLTDVDLHVYEPTGEHANYAHQNTRIGGRVSRDFREGYGPEEYVLRRAYPGVYRIAAHYFASHQQSLTGACTALVTVFTDYARANEKRQLLTLRLEKPGEEVTVGEVALGSPN